MVKILSKHTELVLFLHEEGFNATQIRYICTKILKIKGTNIYNKITLYVKNNEINEAIRKFNQQKIPKKLRLKKLI